MRSLPEEQLELGGFPQYSPFKPLSSLVVEAFLNLS